MWVTKYDIFHILIRHSVERWKRSVIIHSCLLPSSTYDRRFTFIIQAVSRTGVSNDPVLFLPKNQRDLIINIQGNSFNSMCDDMMLPNNVCTWNWQFCTIKDTGVWTVVNWQRSRVSDCKRFVARMTMLAGVGMQQRNWELIERIHSWAAAAPPFCSL